MTRAAGEAAPQLLALPFEHWQEAAALDATAALACGLYLLAATRASRRCGTARAWPVARTLCFLAGIAVVLAALQSGVAAYDERLLSTHMLQHMLLLLPAPLLLLAGRPLTLALRALRGRSRRVLARLLLAARALASSVAGLAALCLALAAWHIPVVYDAAVRHPLVHEAEHATLLLAGLLYLAPLLGADPVSARALGGLGRVVYVLAAMPAMAILGAYLNRAPRVVYRAYAAPARALGVSAVLDQQRAGALMWVGGSVFLVALGLWLVMSALSAEERRLRARERHDERALHARAGAQKA